MIFVKENNSEVGEYLRRLLPYFELNKFVAKFIENYSLDNDFSWITEQQETLKEDILRVINQVSNAKIRRIMKLRYIDGRQSER